MKLLTLDPYKTVTSAKKPEMSRNLAGLVVLPRVTVCNFMRHAQILLVLILLVKSGLQIAMECFTAHIMY
jgi:hypothetical protein